MYYDFDKEMSNISDIRTIDQEVVLNLYYERSAFKVEYKYSEKYEIPEDLEELPELPETQYYVWVQKLPLPKYLVHQWAICLLSGIIFLNDM